jgi:hypothetical protein
MKRITIAGGLLLALLIGHGLAWAEEFTLERYIELSIARLELAKQSWTTMQQPPAAEAVAALFAGYGIEETDYLAYTGSNREAIEAYLAAHPDAQQRIEMLSAEIDQAIQE